jgi:ABC-type spermidine/putrescine transport system permease subunit I
MEPSNSVWRIAILTFVILSGIIGGVSGVLLTDGIWQAFIVAFIVGFGVYLIFLCITLTVLYAVVYRAEELNRDN